MFFRFVQETRMSDPTGPHPTGNISWGVVQHSWPVPVQIAKLPSQPPSSTKYGQSGCWTYEGGQSHLQTELGCSIKRRDVSGQSHKVGGWVFPTLLPPPSPPTVLEFWEVQRREVLTPLHPSLSPVLGPALAFCGCHSKLPQTSGFKQ